MKHGDGVSHAAFSPDGRRVVTASYDKTARVWDAASGQPITQPMRHTNDVNHAAFSPDGRRVVTASDDQRRGCGTSVRDSSPHGRCTMRNR